MNRELRVRFERQGRVLQLWERYKALFADGSPVAAAFQKLQTVMATAHQRVADQVRHGRAGRDQIPPAGEAVVVRLDAIVRTARLIGRTVQGFAEPYRLPRPKRRDVIRTTAEAFLTQAEPHVALFVARGLPADFLDGLRTALADYEQAIDAQRDGRLAAAAANAGLREAMATSSEVVAEIDVLIRNQFADNTELLAAWANARRLDSPGFAKSPATSTTPGTPGTPVAKDAPVTNLNEPAA